LRKQKQTLKVIPLGGLGEVGKNLTVYEYGNEILVVDCGVTFPDEELLGIDLVIPDFTYLEKNREKVKAIVLTHGHEDHIGSIPFLMREMNVPVYGTKLTLGLLKNRLDEYGMAKKVNMKTFDDSSKLQIGQFRLEFIRTNHSLADSVAIVLHTPIGTIVHTGDFKIDHTPIQGKPIDLKKFAAMGKKGVELLLCESTNAEMEGYTISERQVGKIMDGIFEESKSERLIIATFSSNTHRIQEIIDSTQKYRRKLVVTGRSMVKNFDTARELGYLSVKDNTVIDINEIKKFRGNQLVILTTGSQGEPMAALSRMSNGTHKQLKILPKDKIIISASPIPGNEKMVYNVINGLMKKGADVIYKGLMDVHVSGHAKQEELKIMHSLTSPKRFVPIHGEYKHLAAHKKLAVEMGMDKRDIFVMEIGDVLELDGQSARITGKVPAGRVLIDGLGVGDVGNVVLRDRKHLSEDGLIIAFVGIDQSSNTIVSGPDIVSRGFVYEKESEKLIQSMKRMVSDALARHEKNDHMEWADIKKTIKDTISGYVWKEMKRNPLVLPFIIEL